MGPNQKSFFPYTKVPFGVPISDPQPGKWLWLKNMETKMAPLAKENQRLKPAEPQHFTFEPHPRNCFFPSSEMCQLFQWIPRFFCSAGTPPRKFKGALLLLGSLGHCAWF